jgi:hypothetical protein
MDVFVCSASVIQLSLNVIHRFMDHSCSLSNSLIEHLGLFAE